MENELEKIEIKPEDVMETFDRLDEQQAIAELKGQYLEQYVYNFKDNGIEVTGLSLMGVRETARELNKRNLARISISEREPIIIETDDYVEARVYAKDELNGGGYWGIKRQSKKYSTGTENKFAVEQALSKAQRNALRGLIPEPFVKEMITEYLKSGRGVNVKPEQVTKVKKEYKAIPVKEQTQQQQLQQKQQDFDWSKIDLNKVPKWSFSKDKKPVAPPIVKRLFAIAKNYNISKKDFFETSKFLTGKEHSYQWTYGDIKKIEEEMHKVKAQQANEETKIYSEEEFNNENLFKEGDINEN